LKPGQLDTELLALADLIRPTDIDDKIHRTHFVIRRT
jgi:hypothetical protein